MIRISVALPDEHETALRALAEKQGRSRDQMARILLQESLAVRKLLRQRDMFPARPKAEST